MRAGDVGITTSRLVWIRGTAVEWVGCMTSFNVTPTCLADVQRKDQSYNRLIAITSCLHIMSDSESRLCIIPEQSILKQSPVGL